MTNTTPVSDQQLQCFKEMYNGHKIIYVRFSNMYFVFKSLTIKEYELILKLYNDEFKQETAICNMAVISPEDYDFSDCEFGILPSVIAGYIKSISNFDSIDSIFNEYYMVKNNSNLFQQCMDLIKAFIKDYSYEEMEDWTWSKMMEMTARAENVAALQGYDYHISKKEDASNTKMSIHNQEDVNTVINNKMNPLLYFEKEIQEEVNLNNNMLEIPFIIGTGWNNKELLNGFRKQKIKSKK